MSESLRTLFKKCRQWSHVVICCRDIDAVHTGADNCFVLFALESVHALAKSIAPACIIAIDPYDFACFRVFQRQDAGRCHVVFERVAHIDGDHVVFAIRN